MVKYSGKNLRKKERLATIWNVKKTWADVMDVTSFSRSLQKKQTIPGAQ